MPLNPYLQIYTFDPNNRINLRMKTTFLRISLAFMYITFGGLKFFGGLSPAENIGSETVTQITFGLLSPEQALFLLAILEVCIGTLVLFNKTFRIALWLSIFHLICTFLPFIIFPDQVFNLEMNSLSLLGQYIIKNLVIIGAILLIFPSQDHQIQNQAVTD